MSNRNAQVRIHLCDFFALSFILAMQLGWNVLARSPYGHRNLVINLVTIVLCVVWYFVWARCASVLSTADVVSAVKRFVFLAIILPATLLGGAIVVPGCVIFGAWGLIDASFGLIMVWMGIVVSLCSIAIWGPSVTRWVLETELPNQMGVEMNE